jgi:isopenicillin-N epimerase
MFDWTGTADPSAFLVMPEVLRLLPAQVEGGWPALMARNHALALEGRDRLCAALGIDPPAPDAMIGSMAALPIADAAPGTTLSGWAEDPLADTLRHDWRIEVPVMSWPEPPHRVVRVSAQLYNTAADYDRLAEALIAELSVSAVGVPAPR